MKWFKAAYILVLAIAVAAVAIGLYHSREDLLAPGILSVILMVIVIGESIKSKNINPWICIVMGLTLALSIFGVLFTDFTEWAQYLMSTPAYVAIALNIAMYLVAYFGVRLDRLMTGVYLLFLTLAASNAAALIYYYYMLKDGVDNVYEANYWINAEFATALILGIVAVIVVNRIMKKKDIKLLTAKKLLVE